MVYQWFGFNTQGLPVKSLTSVLGQWPQSRTRFLWMFCFLLQCLWFRNLPLDGNVVSHTIRRVNNTPAGREDCVTENAAVDPCGKVIAGMYCRYTGRTIITSMFSRCRQSAWFYSLKRVHPPPIGTTSRSHFIQHKFSILIDFLCVILQKALVLKIQFFFPPLISSLPMPNFIWSTDGSCVETITNQQTHRTLLLCNIWFILNKSKVISQRLLWITQNANKYI